jgi:hypothetical protein
MFVGQLGVSFAAKRGTFAVSALAFVLSACRHASTESVTPQQAVEDHRGEFYSQEVFEGRHIFNRFIWTVTSRDAYRWEQAFSVDGGRTWETNWIMDFTRQDEAGR